jgi:hypothetical protein
MTIQQTIENYRADGKGSVSPTFRALVNQMIDTNAKTEFANDSYADALFLTDVMFERSQTSIRLLTGPSGGDFLHALEGSFEGAINRLKAAGGFVRIVMLNTAMVPDWLSTIQARSGNLDIRTAKAAEGIKHFIVCDSKMARIEAPHSPLDANSDATLIKARVYFNEPSKSKVFEGYFDSIWNFVAKKA